MDSRFEWAGMEALVAISVAAVALTGWQVRVDRSVFENLFGATTPIAVMVAVAFVGVAGMGYLQGSSDFAASGPGAASGAAVVVAWSVPLLAAAAIAADLVLRFDEDMNVKMPDALRFYPVIAVFVEIMLHLVPLAVLVSILGMPTGLDSTFWRVAIPVALIEAAIQVVYATSVGTAIFSGVHLVVFGVVQVWMFWRYGFIWMLTFRLAYYALWHIAWGVARLHLLF